MDKTNILLVGSGGREHALAWKILQSKFLGKLYVAPGNGGTFPYNIPIKATDVDSLTDFAMKKNCFTILGPEAPLELGLVDRLLISGLRSFGPTKEQARLETSKGYAKAFMVANGIPTARFKIFSRYGEAVDYAESQDGNIVIKADGLAAGKGVFLPSTIEEAKRILKSILVDGILGTAGSSVVIEERFHGYEVSYMALCDGSDALMFGTAMDYKRLLDHDSGPNTGGMGAFSPAINFDQKQSEEVLEHIVRPTVRKTGFKGFLYTGLMMTDDGPKVLEFNCRLGDPETQCMIPRLKSDLLSLVFGAENHGIDAIKEELTWDPQFCTCVVMCSRGYPTSVETGFRIYGLDDAKILDGVLIFHAGTTTDAEGQFRTAGGRVICACGVGGDLAKSVERAYSAVRLVSWDGEQHRSDIASQAWCRTT